MSIKSELSWPLLAGLLLCVPRWGQTAPRIEIYAEGQSVAIVGELRGLLQVRADATKFDESGGAVEVRGNVVLSSADERGRVMTLRADQARLSSGDAEFQITDKVRADFADGPATVNRALHDGHIAAYAGGALLRGLQQHPGWSRYRLHYEGVGAGARTSGDIRFDITKQTLVIRETFDTPEAKIFRVDARTYSGVTAGNLQRSVRAAFADNTDKFRNLPRFGATLQSSPGARGNAAT